MLRGVSVDDGIDDGEVSETKRRRRSYATEEDEQRPFRHSRPRASCDQCDAERDISERTARGANLELLMSDGVICGHGARWDRERGVLAAKVSSLADMRDLKRSIGDVSSGVESIARDAAEIERVVSSL